MYAKCFGNVSKVGKYFYRTLELKCLKLKSATAHTSSMTKRHVEAY